MESKPFNAHKLAGFNIARGLFLLLVFSEGFLVQAQVTHQWVGKIMTIQGAVDPDSLGVTLIHEHVFLDWSGADSLMPSTWNLPEAKKIILPHLLEMKSYGVRTFMECTPNYLGRNIPLLLTLGQSTGLQIITNTGFYAAREHQYIPSKLKPLSDEEIAALWIAEWNHGIEGSKVRPGFIKIGVDSKWQLDTLDTKIVRAAAWTHLATGLTIVAHTGDDTTAMQQLNILKECGVSPSAFIWTHAQRGTTVGHKKAAHLGAWISLDGIGWADPTPGNLKAIERYGAFLLALKGEELLDKVLISHDAGWYTAGESDQRYQGYGNIFEVLMPFLNQRGFTEDDWQQLLVENPKRAFRIQVRQTAP